MKKALITGATGFVGGFLVEEALKQDFHVDILLRKSSNTQYIDEFKIGKYYINILDSEQILNHLQSHKYDYIFHNAGITKAKSREDYFNINEGSTIALTDAINKLDYNPKLIFTSSLAAFGPAEYTKSGIISNDTTPNPMTHYGESKLAAEKYLISHASVPYTIVRPTAVYGPREQDLLTVFRSINKGIALYAGKKPQKLTFIYVKDLAKAIITLAISDNTNYKSYFISDDKYYSNQEFTNIVKDYLGRKTLDITLPVRWISPIGNMMEYLYYFSKKVPPLNKDKASELTAQSWICDTKTLKEDIGYKSDTSLRTGIEKTIDWYKEHNWL